MEHVLVTGASGGLGLSIARALAAGGRQVYAGSRNVDRMRRELSDAGDRVICFPMDVSDEDSVRNALEEVTSRTDHLDVVINNAGILIWDTVENTIESLDIKNIEKTISTNSIGPLRVLKHAMPLLYAGSTHLVINISSDAGSLGLARHKTWYDYCMSKAALNMASKILQNYLQERKVKVIAVHPGWVRTPMSGPKAALDADDVAAKIVALMERKWQLSDPIYMDNDGKEMPW